ncbi:hypothetical protein ACFSKM_27940 [Ancylobacter dichloromethanicus]
MVVIDFFTHPLTNLEPSLTLLGEATGRAAQARDFLAFRRERLDAVRAKLDGLAKDERPRVFLEPHAAMTADCCNSPGRGNVGDIIEAVGGTNIGAAVIPRAFGKLNLEYVIAQDPQVYIATGGSHMEGTAGLLIGPEYSAERARETLARVVARPGFFRSCRRARPPGARPVAPDAQLAARPVHGRDPGEMDPPRTLRRARRRPDGGGGQ